MSNARLTNAQILASVQFVDPNNPSQPSHLRMLAKILAFMSAESGQEVRLAVWPDGAVIAIAGNPSDKAAWDKLVIASYRQAETGVLGQLIEGAS